MTNQTQTTRQQPNGRAAQTPPPAATPAPQPTATTPPVQPAPAAVTFNEAPSSINLRFDYKGYEGIQLTLRDVSGAQLLQKLDAVIVKLAAMGATPTAERNRNASGRYASERGGQAQGETSTTSAIGEAIPVCQYHGPMKASTKKPGSYYCPAKMGDGSYCKEKSG